MKKLFTSGRKRENFHLGVFLCAEFKKSWSQALFPWDPVKKLELKMAANVFGSITFCISIFECEISLFGWNPNCNAAIL